MLREIESASARVGDISVSPGGYSADSHTQDRPGGRTFCCVCGVVVHPLCPVHAAARRLARLRALGADSPDGPLFPDRSRGATAKQDWVAMLHRVLSACEVGTHLVTAQGDVVPKFGGHTAKVTGASFLVANGVPLPTVQLLGRWSSMAIERYSQAAPLALAPQAADLALRNCTGRKKDWLRRRLCLRVAGANPRPQAWGEWRPAKSSPEYREALCREPGQQ